MTEYSNCDIDGGDGYFIPLTEMEAFDMCRDGTPAERLQRGAEVRAAAKADAANSPRNTPEEIFLPPDYLYYIRRERERREVKP